MIRMMIELTAGNFEKLEKVIQYGADAVYLGLNQFNLRAAGGNFNLYDQLPQAIELAHKNGVKAYLTLNSLVRDHDFADLEMTIKALPATGIDAVIVTDPGVLQMVRKFAPSTIHISTQSSVLNSQTAMFGTSRSHQNHFSTRVSLTDIRTVRQNIPEDLELEAFVHGAMCMSYSGRCILSDYFNARW